MADRPAASKGAAKPKATAKGNVLTKKYGPLPGYAWVGIVAVGGFLVYELFLKGSGSSSGVGSGPLGSTSPGGGGGGTGPNQPNPPPFPGPGGSDQPPPSGPPSSGPPSSSPPSSPGGGGKTPSAASQPTPASHTLITTVVDHVAPYVAPKVGSSSSAIGPGGYNHTINKSGIPGLNSTGSINPNYFHNTIPVGHSAQNVAPNLAPGIRTQTNVGTGRAQPVVQAQTPAEALNTAFHNWLATHHGGTSAQFSQQLNAAAAAARNRSLAQHAGSANITHTTYATKTTGAAQVAPSRAYQAAHGSKSGYAPQIRALRVA